MTLTTLTRAIRASARRDIPLLAAVSVGIALLGGGGFSNSTPVSQAQAG